MGHRDNKELKNKTKKQQQQQQQQLKLSSLN